jgi:adenosylmethionine-8-amino-7-oxononanoate aminotransferase
VRELCDRYQVHLIADEIAVGFGRTGTLFACEQAALPLPLGEGRGEGAGPDQAFPVHQPVFPLPQPLPRRGRGVSAIADFLCLSKGITGGYLPLSCVLTSDAVYAAFYGDATARGFLHSHSYTGNPLACRAALAVLDIFEQDDVIAANRVKAARFSELLGEVAAHPCVRNFRHTGMIWAFDVVDAAPGFATEFHRRALERGVFIRPIGNTVYFMPPYVIEEPEMRLLAETTLACL